jgi:pilus assembly protein CpaF
MFERFSGRDGDKPNGKTGSFAGGFSRRESSDETPAEPDTSPAPVPETTPPEPKVDKQAKGPNRYTDLKVHLHRRLLDMMNLSVIDQMTPEEFRGSVGEMVQELVHEEQTPLNQAEQTQLIADILDEVLGLGPLEPLLKDPTVTDILVNTHESVFVERGGKLEHTEVQFKDARHLLRIIDRIVSGVGRRVDESQPMVDARLLDGSRVNAIIPPLAVDGPLVSIRKFAKDPINMAKLVSFGALPAPIAEVLRGIVEAKRNVLISGGTGSGKTTMLNAMSAFIDHQERIITIEDAAELQLQQIHVARLETRPANIEGKGEVGQRELVKNALRMRPDRVIVGEVRGGEAFDMLQAMNTGHEGSMTTVHANTCRDALSRLEQMIGMAGLELSGKAMREQIASAINVVIQVQRMSDGSRRLQSVSEVTGMEGEVITMQEIFNYKRRSTDADGTIHGEFVANGVRPSFMSEFEARNIESPANVFDPLQPLE